MASNHINGVSVTYGYDDLNRLASVTDARLAGSQTTAYTYDEANNLAGMTYPNGVAAQFAYDQLNRVSGLASQLAGYTYQRDATGKLTSVAEQSGRAVNWSYDGINRLTGETISLAPSGYNGAVSYTLDPVGNRLSEVSSLGGVPSGTWGYNADDEVSGESYDANGNVTSSSGRAYAYDSENHLVPMNGGAVTLVYDGDGNRAIAS